MHRSVAGWITHSKVKYVVILFWVALLVGLGPLAAKLGDVQKNDQKSFLPGNAESTKVLDIQAKFGSANTIPAIVLYESDGKLTKAELAKIASDAQKISARDDLDTGELAKFDGQVPVIPSEDGMAAQLYVPLDLGVDGFDKVSPAIESLKKIADADAGGLATYITGPAGQADDFSKAFEGIDTTLLFAAGGVVIVMLLLTYRSPILWLLPVISAGVALGLAQSAVYLLAKYADLTVNGQSAGILTVLVFGAGTDYALLIVARYREELRRHENRHEAMGKALHRASPAVIASGATVIVGLLCLLLAQINSTRGLGPVTAVGIAVGLLVMLTLLPALLVLVGRWIFWPRIPHFGDTEPNDTGIWSRVGVAISKAPRATWVVTTVILAALTVGIVSLDATGLTNKEQFTKTQPSVEGEEALGRHFNSDESTPVVIATTENTSQDILTVLQDVEGLEASRAVVSPEPKDGYSLIQVPLTGAADSSEAADTVERTREAVGKVDGADALVGGTTAINADVQRLSGEDNRLIIPIILIAVFLILGLLLRAIAAPVILIVTVVLSFGAALGVSGLVFDHVLGFGGADTSFPLFAFVFLVALGIDYNIFLMTRVREEALEVGTRRGALIGLSATGGVITSAGLVLAGTFAVLATLPLVFLAELGFVVAFGVLLDTIIVRSVLVTALNLDIGRWMWWPSSLWKTDGPDHLADNAHPAEPVDTTGPPMHKA
ncbi:MMPL family transporter [Aeromicrobium stalagmiti]|uniref:MMPL family transporter n=1 Tax=Aeromicrobium stalagmiti TaxID=2738988 RepID=UPI0015683603|nr:MMPL family transporter [Aeromicrobium stalagmiti]NRQ51219.1 MMPL family transporter [Aeromicrobium stalagmiti]